MLEVRNTQFHEDMTFDEYLAMPGYSYSKIKGFQGPPNAGMSLGTRVHNYLNEPHLYDWKDAPEVIKIATALKAFLGDSYKFMKKELAFSCEFHYEGIVMKYKGRADMIKVGSILVDLKVLSGSLESSCERFGYPFQISGYCLASATPLGLILAYNRSKGITETKIIKPEHKYWEYQVARFGTPL